MMVRTRKLYCLAIVAITAFAVSGCMQSIRRSPLEPIGIMGALDSEIELIKEAMGQHSSTMAAGRTYYRGKIGVHSVVLVKAGVGKVNAAMAAQAMINRFGVKNIIFTGIAGGINPDLHVGDVVISNKVIQHDYGFLGKDGFHPGKISMPDAAGEERAVAYFEPDSHLVGVARRAADRVNFPTPDTTISPHVAGPIKVYEGCIVTGDQFIASEEKRVWLQETFDAYATEMEGGAVAQVCAANGVPFVIVRTLSDLANEDASIDIEKFFFYASHNSATLVLEMLKLLP
jgi:adenosylhomocysteine nucleosidase